ncbi:MAG: lytic transglycosylase domain-containing protein [Clostridia bacterium]|nr:lytic transglycosylase domain-containing protein [Clostridia bacterium]
MEKRRSPTEILLEITIIGIILALVVIAFSSDAVRSFFGKMGYKKEYSEHVEKYSELFGVDENLVYAVIKAESGFDPDATSRQGARGLMQIMPTTYLYDIAPVINTPADADALYDPETNIHAGIYYLSRLIDYFGSTRSGIAAYNAGATNVRRWLSDPALCDDSGELDISEIPFSETKAYVGRVEKFFEKYTELYRPKDVDKPDEPTVPVGSGDEPQPPPDDKPEKLIIDADDAFALAKKYGEMYGVDPCLVMAVIHVESAFDAHAVSSSNALGLMQIKMSTYLGDIMPATGTPADKDALFDAETNIKAGTYYLHWLTERLVGVDEVIVAYNYGIGNVIRMLKDPEYSSDGVTLLYDKIPNASARNYHRWVMERYEEYKAVYGSK